MQAILRAIDRSTPIGLYALLLMMNMYGCGAGEVIRLQLEDIDWRGSKLHLKRRPKTHVPIELPLLPEAGCAIADYLQRGRPRHTALRAIFVTDCFSIPGAGLVLYRAGENVEVHLPTLSTYLGHCNIQDTYSPVGLPGADGHDRAAAREALGVAVMRAPTVFSTLLERFFTERLMQQRYASPHTVASYRDTFRLLFEFAQKTLHKPPSSLDLPDIDAALVGNFLNAIERQRRKRARTRNLRLTAIRSFCHFASLHDPARCAHFQRILAIPKKAPRSRDQLRDSCRDERAYRNT